VYCPSAVLSLAPDARGVLAGLISSKVAVRPRDYVERHRWSAVNLPNN
jgi:hypothetical protein